MPLTEANFEALLALRDHSSKLKHIREPLHHKNGAVHVSAKASNGQVCGHVIARP